MDYAATTPLRKSAFAAMEPFLGAAYGNASGVYTLAREAKRAIETAREQIAAAIGARTDEIFFTGSGTEANNWALQRGGDLSKTLIISSQTEHHSILYVCEALSKENGENIFLAPNSEGIILASDFEAALKENANKIRLASIMWANNETGALIDSRLPALAKEYGVLFHTDAIQAIGHVPVNVQNGEISMLSMSAHKFGGPKGIGALYIRKGTKIKPLIYGGAHERNMRAGTENVASIVGMGVAITEAISELESEQKRLRDLTDALTNYIIKEVPDTTANGPIDATQRLPNIANIQFNHIEGEGIILLLDSSGISVSAGSACTSATLEPSHVLAAMGVPHEKIHGSVRFSLGRESTQKDVDELLAVLPKVVKNLRAMSPVKF